MLISILTAFSFFADIWFRPRGSQAHGEQTTTAVSEAASETGTGAFESQLIGKMSHMTTSLLDVKGLRPIPCIIIALPLPQCFAEGSTSYQSLHQESSVDGIDFDLESGKELELMKMVGEEDTGGKESYEMGSVDQVRQGDADEDLEPCDNKTVTKVESFSLQLEADINLVQEDSVDKEPSQQDKLNSRRNSYRQFVQDQESLTTIRCRGSSKALEDEGRKLRQKNVYLCKQKLYQQLVDEQETLNFKKYNSVIIKQEADGGFNAVTFYFVSTILVIVLALVFSYWVYVILSFL